MANLKHVEQDPKHVKMSGEILETCAQNPAASASSSARVELVEVPCAIPSFAAASELVSAPYSCLVMNTHRRHVVLPPVYLNKKRTALREELQAELLKFSPSLQGVPLAYDNIQIVRRHGDIYDDSGYIHLDIQANFIIFQPKEGQRLLGKVNKLGMSHVGCLVHGCFNASIPKPNLVSVDTWREAGPRIGAELEFEVIALDADTAGVLLIRGRLNRIRVQELLAIAEISDSGVTADQAELEDAEPVTDPTEESIVQDSTKKKKKKEKIKEEVIREKVVSPSHQDGGNGTESNANGEKKKKKKKKDKIKEEVTEEEVVSPTRQDDGNAPLELNGAESDANGEKRKKKKMKKEKRIKEEEEQVQLSPMEIHASDSSGYHSDKPNKKRKHEKESQVTASFSQGAEEPKSKKKKRKSDIV